MRRHVRASIGDAHKQSRSCGERSRAGPKRALRMQWIPELRLWLSDLLRLLRTALGARLLPAALLRLLPGLLTAALLRLLHRVALLLAAGLAVATRVVTRPGAAARRGGNVGGLPAFWMRYVISNYVLAMINLLIYNHILFDVDFR